MNLKFCEFISLDRIQLNEDCLHDKLAIDPQNLSFECINLTLLLFLIREEASDF
jgi:hypothetical protein